MELAAVAEQKKETGFFLRAFLTGFGAGYLPVAPGTWGSIEALGIVLLTYWLVPAQAFLILLLLLVVLVPLGVMGATRLARIENDPDPSKIVIDEAAGQMLTLVFVAPSLWALLVGFLLFRFFDIVKPFPIRRSERLPGGIGIMCDDILAGVYAGILLKILTGLM